MMDSSENAVKEENVEKSIKNVKCPSCYALNPPEAVYCMKCGNNLVKSIEDGSKEKMDQKLREDALTLLRDPAFFYRLGKVFEYGFFIEKVGKVRFIIGEEEDKRLLPIMLAASTKMRLTPILRVVGEVGTAKDSMIRMSLDLLREGLTYEERGFFSPATIRYSQDIKSTDVLYIPDSPSFTGEVGRQLRLMRADDGGLISEYVFQDPKTHLMATKKEYLPVKTIVTSSNELGVDLALESGAWTLETDGSKELTRRVQEEKLRLEAGLRPSFPEDELRVWRAAFKIALTEDLPQKITIPYAEKLMVFFSEVETSQRRSPDKLCDLIKAVAFFRRFQKPPEKRCEADLVDLFIALRLGGRAISKTIFVFDERERAVLNAFSGRGEHTIREIADNTKIPYKTCYKVLERLVERGFLGKEKEGGKNVYYPINYTGEKESEKLIFSRDIRVSDFFLFLKLFSGFPIDSSTSPHPPIYEFKVVDPLTGREIDICRKDGKIHIKWIRAPPSLESCPFKPCEKEALKFRLDEPSGFKEFMTYVGGLEKGRGLEKTSNQASFEEKVALSLISQEEIRESSLSSPKSTDTVEKHSMECASCIFFRIARCSKENYDLIPPFAHPCEQFFEKPKPDLTLEEKLAFSKKIYDKIKIDNYAEKVLFLKIVERIFYNMNADEFYGHLKKNGLILERGDGWFRWIL